MVMVFGENPGKFIDQYSNDFVKNFLDQLKIRQAMREYNKLFINDDIYSLYYRQMLFVMLLCGWERDTHCCSS